MVSATLHSHCVDTLLRPRSVPAVMAYQSERVPLIHPRLRNERMASALSELEDRPNFSRSDQKCVANEFPQPSYLDRDIARDQAAIRAHNAPTRKNVTETTSELTTWKTTFLASSLASGAERSREKAGKATKPPINPTRNTPPILVISGHSPPGVVKPTTASRATRKPARNDPVAVIANRVRGVIRLDMVPSRLSNAWRIALPRAAPSTIVRGRIRNSNVTSDISLQLSSRQSTGRVNGQVPAFHRRVTAAANLWFWANSRYSFPSDSRQLPHARPPKTPRKLLVKRQHRLSSFRVR